MSINIQRFCVFVGVLVNASACWSGSDGTSFGAGTSEIEESGIDVQVLQIWTPGQLLPKDGDAERSGTADVAIDAAERCVTVRSTRLAAYEEREVDCAAA